MEKTFDMKIINQSVVRNWSTCALAFVLSVLTGGCAFPGMGVSPEGSEVWTKENAAGTTPIFQTITPDLIVSLAASKKALNAYSKTPIYRPVISPERQAYRIGAGDVVYIVVWDHPELTNPAGTQTTQDLVGRLVLADGTIFFPHVGRVKIENMTVDEVRSHLTEKLSRVIESPQVDVRVIEYRSKAAYVVGDDLPPCRVPMTDKETNLLEALGYCQGQNQYGNYGNNYRGNRGNRGNQRRQQGGYQLSGDSANRTIHITRGEMKKSFSQVDLYKGSAAGQNFLLQHGDLIRIANDTQHKVFVVGEVNFQSVVPIPTKGLTLAEAITNPETGGINLLRANSNEVFVIRGLEIDTDGDGVDQLVPEIYQLNAESADALILADRFDLQPRDIVFVATAGVVRYNTALKEILPTLQTLVQFAILADRN